MIAQNREQDAEKCRDLDKARDAGARDRYQHRHLLHRHAEPETGEPARDGRPAPNHFGLHMVHNGRHHQQDERTARKFQPSHCADHEGKERVAQQLDADGPADRVPSQAMDDIGLEQQDDDRQVSQPLGGVMGAEPRLAPQPQAEDHGQHEEVQRIDAEDAAQPEVAQSRAGEVPDAPP